MPGKALSKLKKRSRSCKEQDKRLRDAAGLWKKEVQHWEREVATHPDKDIPQPSLRQFSKAHNVNRTTLARHTNGAPHTTKAESSQMQQKLSPEEEGALINAAIDQGRRGFPLTHDR